MMHLSPSPEQLPAADLRPEEIERGSSLWVDAWHRLIKNRLAIVGATIVLLFVLACTFGPMIFHLSYQDQNLALGASAPSGEHLLGTDTLGRDLLARILYGGRISLMVGLVASLVALFIGVTWGAIAGYAGGKVDS